MLRKLIAAALMATAMATPATAAFGLRGLHREPICLAHKGFWDDGNCWFRIF